MDENPCTEVAVKSENGALGLRAGFALAALIEGKLDEVEFWMRRIPRSQRGRVKIALDDLDMIISRLGN